MPMRSNNKKSVLWLRCAALAVAMISISAALGCGGSSSSNNNNNNGGTQVIASVGPNAVALTLDQGTGAIQGITNAYLNGVWVSVNVCVPGSTTNCQTIDHVLVDTGSFGLRLLDASSGGQFDSSQLTIQNGSDGNPIGECVQFVDGSFLWGPVATADVKFASPTTEVASSVPVHLVGDNSFPHVVPNSCSSNGTGIDDDSLAALGANGIIGVGNLQQDCGAACAPGGAVPIPSPAYYSCPVSGCVPEYVALNQQVQNPVALFATDNNGVIMEIPPVASGGVAQVNNGVLVFGIGTQTNNALGSASVLTLDNTLGLTTSYKGTNYPGSFVDSGSNAFFFLDSNTTGLSQCGDAVDFYCPSSTQNLTATNTGQSGSATTVNFSVANADNLFNSGNFIFSNIGGPNSGVFDWGLPFFMGRNVFVSIQGKTAPGGTAPYVAY
jgi:hypothetical protein